MRDRSARRRRAFQLRQAAQAVKPKAHSQHAPSNQLQSPIARGQVALRSKWRGAAWINRAGTDDTQTRPWQALLQQLRGITRLVRACKTALEGEGELEKLMLGLGASEKRQAD